MERAGAVALLLEAIPAEVGEIIARRTALPVIGCVAGPSCDGTVVVLHDMLGYTAGHPPRSVKRYANLHDVLKEAFRAYAADVTEARFPTLAHSVTLTPVEAERLLQDHGAHPSSKAELTDESAANRASGHGWPRAVQGSS